MIKIVKTKPAKEMAVDEVLGSRYIDSKILFAYKSTGKSGWCFLAKLTSSSDPFTRYGFVAMNYTDTHPRFVADTVKKSLELAVDAREVYAFNGVEELVYAITNKL